MLWGSLVGIFLPTLLLLPDGGVGPLDRRRGGGRAGLLFHSLTLRVDGEALTWYFGPHFWTNDLDLDDIERVERVRNSPWMGWAIRGLRDGWLSNGSGLDAMEVETTEGSVARIRTDDPDRQVDALERARTVR